MPDLAVPRRPWTPEEDQTLRGVYGPRGWRAVAAALPHRTQAAIHSRLFLLGIRRGRAPRFSPAEDAAIRLYYPTGGRNAVARVIRRPGMAISLRAAVLGVARVGKDRRARWTPREDQVLRDVYPAGGLAAAMAALPERTEGAIQYRRGITQVRRVFIRQTAEQRAVAQRASQRAAYIKGRGARLEVRRKRNEAGLCRCGRVPVPGRGRCAMCLRHAVKNMFKKRRGVAPVAHCTACKKRWALPGSEFCGLHQAKTADR